MEGDEKVNDSGPYAKIDVEVRNDDGRDQRGVRVFGVFTIGYEGTVVGVTNGKGKVTFLSGPVDGDRVRFRVTNLTHPDYVYEPDDNRRGPAIVVEFD